VAAARALPAAVRASLHAVYVDPHLLATPILVDLDADDRMELITVVSYYFSGDVVSDEAARARRQQWGHVDERANLTDYVIAELVAWDVDAGTIKWRKRLEMTSQRTAYAAFRVASPIAADLNGDGHGDIAVALATGFVYVVGGRTQALFNGYPLSADSVYAPLVAYDFNADGAADLLIVDSNGAAQCSLPLPDGSLHVYYSLIAACVYFVSCVVYLFGQVT